MIDIVTSRNVNAFNKKVSTRTVKVLNRRTSVRVEPVIWRSLKDIARREKCSLHELFSLIYLKKEDNMGFSASIRLFAMLYYKAAATESGHHHAGHGDFEAMKKRANVIDDLTTLSQKKSGSVPS